ncbi:hypothetical protein RND71_000542 [Anisodus tanguticus]|uniref:HRDC domain-containing protein n=1 Tax=Anisodus tanguticus TaxID=243964 RepID=A0AAE1SZN5_9SOLA|nr:hypothetical protein RND71_000542 [Anisodus tanguticus]
MVGGLPSSVKASKLGKSEATPATGSLTSRKQSLPRTDPSAVPRSPVDTDLSAKQFPALRKLRTILVKEAGDGVMACLPYIWDSKGNKFDTLYSLEIDGTLQQICQKVPRTTNELLDISGIGKVKITKYGDRLLETIEATIREHRKSAKTSSSGNDTTDSGKKRRNSISVQNGNSKDEEYFTEKHWTSTLRRCKCPICCCLISELVPEASLLVQQEEDVVELLKKIRRYNHLYISGAYGVFLERQLF